MRPANRQASSLRRWSQLGWRARFLSASALVLAAVPVGLLVYAEAQGGSGLAVMLGQSPGTSTLLALAILIGLALAVEPPQGGNLRKYAAQLQRLFIDSQSTSPASVGSPKEQS